MESAKVFRPAAPDSWAARMQTLGPALDLSDLNLQVKVPCDFCASSRLGTVGLGQA